MNLSAFAARTGPLPDTVKHPWAYFASRGIFLDTRGPLVIHGTSRWGLGVRVITRSHGIFNGPGILNPTIDYGVTVAEGAWIGSYSILAGCRVEAGAIVAVGSVVRGQVVGPDVLVAGNPARVIARWNGKAWIYLSGEESGYHTRLL